MKLSHGVSGAVRRFSYWIANGTVGYPLLEGIDYFHEFQESPSLLEYAEQRAAQYIKQYCVKDYVAEPTFKGSEELDLY